MFYYILILSIFLSSLQTSANDLHWMKIEAQNKQDRSAIANTGVALEQFADDFVIALGNSTELKQVQSQFNLLASLKLGNTSLDFPFADQNFHNYSEFMDAANTLGANNTDIVSIEDIGKSLEGRSIINIRISTDLSASHLKPAIVFIGTHHAREHLSTEVPLLLAKHLVNEYRKNNPRIISILKSREIHIIPMLNPDGVEYDIIGGKYRKWRKNRRKNNDGTIGVDLNRNYGFQWGTGGSSSRGASDTYKGSKAFSEPETIAIKNFIEAHTNITILLSFHSFSELIMYPWAHKYSPITNQKDLAVHKKLANKMATWNNYKVQQASDLYIASGDTTDWSYGVHGIISFTFELDPKMISGGGFYPGQKIIPGVFKKNLEPCLYLMEKADNPYNVLKTKSQSLGLTTALF